MCLPKKKTNFPKIRQQAKMSDNDKKQHYKNWINNIVYFQIHSIAVNHDDSNHR